MKSYSSDEVIALLKADGWYHVRTHGDHWHFKHANKKRLTTVPHPKKDLRIDELKSIERQSGLKFD